MSNNMIECPICSYRHANTRMSCPTCGSFSDYDGMWSTSTNGVKYSHKIVVARGAERARQLPQSPRVFQLVD